MYTIKHAASRVGISPATLRAWERRYGVVRPGRTDGGYRVYSAADVAAVATMKRLIDDGWPARLAAAEAGRRARGPASLGSPSVPGDDATDPAPSALASALVAAAADLDAPALGRVLDEMFAGGSFEQVVQSRLFPALYALGEAWADGRVSVAGEHLASNAVMRRMAAAYEAATAGGHGPRILLGMAPGRRHELGLFSFAVAARRRGLDTEYLGTDLPVEDWAAASSRPRVSAIVLALTGPDDVAPTAEVISAVRARRPDLLIAVGGAEQDSAPAGVLRLGHDIELAADALAESLLLATA